jgi:hypothetical protein
MVVVDMAAADTSAVDTLWPPHMLGSDQDLLYASRRGIAPVYSSRVDNAAISGMAVGGITVLAHAGGGRTFMASTFGCAIRAAKAHRRAATCSIYQLPIDGLPDFQAGTSMPTMRTPKEAGEGIMFTGLLAVLIVGTLAGSVDTDRGDGCYRAQCYPRYDRGYYGGCGGYDSYGGCGGYRGYPGYGGYGGYSGCGGYNGCGSNGAYSWSGR